MVFSNKTAETVYSRAGEAVAVLYNLLVCVHVQEPKVFSNPRKIYSNMNESCMCVTRLLAEVIGVLFCLVFLSIQIQTVYLKARSSLWFFLEKQT